MSMRTKVLSMVDVMMRVPPVLVMDEILKINMGLPVGSYHSSKYFHVDAANQTELPSVTSTDHSMAGSVLVGESPAKTLALEQGLYNASAAALSRGMLSASFGTIINELAKDSNLAYVLSITSVRFVICLLGFVCAACLFMLRTRHLVMVYMFITSLALIFLSYWSNVATLALMEQSPCMIEDILSLNSTRLLNSGNLAVSLVPHLAAQWFMGTLFAYIHLGPRYETLQKAMPFIFASPILFAMFPLPRKIIKYTPLLADVIPLILRKITLMNSAMKAGKTIYNGYQYAVNFVSNFGLSALIENEWHRLNVPSVLRVFWIIRIIQGLTTIVVDEGITSSTILPSAQKLLVDGCETLIAVLGMTSLISILCHYIGKLFQWYLVTFDNDEEKSLGIISAVLFYILALQTGLTSLPPEKRFVRLCRNFCLLVTALLQFLHNIVAPILMSLSAARNPSRKRHLRALSVCIFLIISPICLLRVLWSRHSLSTWLLAVTAFSLEVVIKVLVSMATYTLFLLDARRQTFWEKLDDYIYYVRSFGNTVEFCFGILLFFNGAWILIFESAENVTGSAIRAIMMCIHAYFNIWCEARAGWSVFMKRRSAVYKISSLPEATSAQLRTFDDVCAICYQEMSSAKITRCRHFFHGVCLRKWLYVQDRCPLCHEIVMHIGKGDDQGDHQAADRNPLMQIYPIEQGANMDGGIRIRGANRTINVMPTGSQTTATSLPTTEATTSTSSSPMSANRLPTTTTGTTSSTATAAAAVATAAASNRLHGLPYTPDMEMSD